MNLKSLSKGTPSSAASGRLLGTLLLFLILWTTASAGLGALGLDSLAWTRYLSSYEIHGVVDSVGNAYTASEVHNNTGGTDVSLIKMDISGNVVLNKVAFTIPGTNSDIDHMCVSPVIAGAQYVYIQTEGFSENSKLFVTVEKVDVLGNLIWSKTYGGISDQFGTVNVAADASGNCYVCLFPIGDSSTSIEMLTYTPAGIVVHDLKNKLINPVNATFSSGKWLVDGHAPNQIYGSISWALFDAATGALNASASLNTLDTGTFVFTYTGTTYWDPNGTIYWGVTVNKYQSSGSPQPLLINHFVRSYQTGGALNWTSTSYQGYLTQINGYGSGGTLWTLGAVGTNAAAFVEAYDSTGSRTCQTTGLPATTNAIVAEDFGAYVLITDPANKKNLMVQRLSPTGNLLFTNSIAASSAVPNDQSQFQNAQFSNGVLYTFAMVSTGISQGVVQRFFRGVTLMSVTGPATVASNGTLTMKVQLNNPAPAGGMAIKLTSSSGKLLFPNNSNAYTMAIPAGSYYANVVLHAGAVVVNTAAIIAGNSNGVIRQSTVAVTP
jgi:hypothetical protein